MTASGEMTLYLADPAGTETLLAESATVVAELPVPAAAAAVELAEPVTVEKCGQRSSSTEQMVAAGKKNRRLHSKSSKQVKDKN